MKIKRNHSLREVQERFSNELVGFKIEFSRPAEAGYDAPYYLLEYNLDILVSQLNPDIEEIDIDINQDDT